MRFLRGIGAVFCLLSIILICVITASVFNEGLSEVLKDMGEEVLSAIHEFSGKADINVFSEVTSD